MLRPQCEAKYWIRYFKLGLPCLVSCRIDLSNEAQRDVPGEVKRIVSLMSDADLAVQSGEYEKVLENPPSCNPVEI